MSKVLTLYFCSLTLLLTETLAKVDSSSFPGQTLQDDYVTFPINDLIKLQYPVFTLRNATTCRNVPYYYAQLENPQRLHVITARDRGCPGVATTSETAHKLACQVAVNAGFFNMQSGDCIGNVVSRGHYAQISGLRNVNFGITLDGNFIVGYLTKQTVCSLPFTELVAGVIWLVREGRPFWEESAIIEGPDFMDILAPRTVLGHDRFGRALLLVVEGTETVDENDQRTASGVTISELGQLASSLGMYNAINLDGGGSSAFVIDGRLVNRITESCPDDPLRICERPITTIICIK